ncbi:hypothetical protein PV343_16035 [Streptomyces sp. WI03-4A]|uniref:hypothetical protein n=1 Tax=Streptomyces sp. WI03-4A TaxID=3028706 RepID=UPI0029BF8000|nr:hypothetical protein [Streptomyces sp. WI03-4A]MDX2593736.1 hypothetical protein [Streptomyces sp. WI03-4A]
MDLDAVADELYGLAPDDFTTARDTRAKAARAAGNRELAGEIRRLRRPTLAAWASNLLVRERPTEVRNLLQLGEGLRQAHQDLDGERLRELSVRQHQLTFALARQAAELTARAGRSIGEAARQDVQDTLQAALADPEAAEEWAAGRLTKPLSVPVGFPAATRQPASRAPTPGRAARAAASVTDLEEARARRDDARKRLQHARRLATEAQQELRACEEELAAAEKEQSRADEAERQAGQRVADLSRQLRDAEREQRQAREAARTARDGARAADRAAREARRLAGDTEARAQKLAEKSPGPT